MTEVCLISQTRLLDAGTSPIVYLALEAHLRSQRPTPVRRLCPGGPGGRLGLLVPSSLQQDWVQVTRELSSAGSSPIRKSQRPRLPSRNGLRLRKASCRCIPGGDKEETEWGSFLLVCMWSLRVLDLALNFVEDFIHHGMVTTLSWIYFLFLLITSSTTGQHDMILWRKGSFNRETHSSWLSFFWLCQLLDL